MFKICLTFSCLLLLISCQQTPEPALTEISNSDLNAPVHKLTDIVEDIDFIKIEDGQIYTPLTADIILLDWKTRNNFKAYSSCFLIYNPEKHIDVYNLQGKFLFQFGKPGKGPGEYSGVKDFCYNPFNHQYAISSPQGLHLYDSTGNHICTHKWPNTIPHIVKMEYLTSDQLVAGGAIRNTKTTCPYFLIDTVANLTPLPYNRPDLSVGVCSISTLENDIFCVTNDSVFLIQKNSFILHHQYKYTNEELGIRLYCENSDFRMFHTSKSYPEKSEYLYVLQSKRDQSLHIISPKTQDDCFLNLDRSIFGFVIDAWSVLNNKLVVTIPAIEFKDMVDKAASTPDQSPYYEKARQIAQGINEDSNSIIALVTLKKL